MVLFPTPIHLPYTKGLALSRMALCDGEKSRFDEAVSAYKAAGKINTYKEVVGRTLILFDELAKADVCRLLGDVKEVLLAATINY